MTDENDNVIGESLTPQQEAFCRYYTQNDVFMGNATLAYAEAFGFPLDEQPRDDAQYRFNDGEIYAEHELEDLPREDKHHISRGKKIQESSYQKMYDNCSTYASKLRKRDYIQKRCRELLNEYMVDEVIDARLIQIIRKGDDNDAINAIKEYNKLKQRIVDKKDVTSGGKPIQIVFDPVFNEKSAQQTEGNNLG